MKERGGARPALGRDSCYTRLRVTEAAMLPPRPAPLLCPPLRNSKTVHSNKQPLK